MKPQLDSEPTKATALSVQGEIVQEGVEDNPDEFEGLFVLNLPAAGSLQAIRLTPLSVIEFMSLYFRQHFFDQE